MHRKGFIKKPVGYSPAIYFARQIFLIGIHLHTGILPDGIIVEKGFKPLAACFVNPYMVDIIQSLILNRYHIQRIMGKTFAQITQTI